MADTSKSVGALVNGLIRQQFYDDKDITNDFLKSEIFPDMNDDSFILLVNKYRGILKSMASSNMDLTQAETFLSSQAKKRDSGMSDNHVKMLLKSWKNHKDRINESLKAKCSWENQLKNLSWRIDVKTRSKNEDQLSLSTVIVEMVLGSRHETRIKDEVVRFEMDEQSITKLTKSIKDIEEQLDRHCAQ